MGHLLHAVLSVISNRSIASFIYFLQIYHSADGFYGGNSGLSPQFLVVRGNKKEKLKAYGSMKLEAGDRLDVLTAGGGGFGE